MKYVKSREQFINEQFEPIYEYVGSKGTFHNDTKWSDSLVGKLFSAIGKKIKKVVKKGVTGKYLNELESEFKKGQALAVQNDEVVQKLRVNQNIINLWNMINSKNFDYGNFILMLDTVIKDYETFIKDKNTLPKYKTEAETHLSNLKEFSEKVKGGITEAVDPNLPKEKAPSDEDLSDIDFHKIDLKKMRGELTFLNQQYTNETDKKRKEDIKKLVTKLKKRISEKEFDIQSMEKELANKTVNQPTEFTVTYVDPKTGEPKTVDASNPQNPNDKYVNVNANPKNPKQTITVSYDNVIDVDSKANKAKDDATDKAKDDDLNAAYDEFEGDAEEPSKDAELSQEQIITLFGKYYSKETLKQYNDDANITSTEAKRLNDVLIKNAGSDKEFINPIAVMKIFNKAELNAYSVKSDGDDSRTSRKLDDDLFLQWTNGVLTLLENYKQYLPKALVDFINDMLQEDNFMNSKAQKELLAKYFKVNYDPATNTDKEESIDLDEDIKANYKYEKIDALPIDKSFGKVFIITANTKGYIGDGTEDSGDMVFYMIGMTNSKKYYRFIVSKNDATYLKAIDKDIPVYKSDNKSNNSEYLVFLSLADLKKLTMNFKKGSNVKFKRLKPALAIKTVKDPKNASKNALTFGISSKAKDTDVVSDEFEMTINNMVILKDVKNKKDFTNVMNASYGQYNSLMQEITK